MLSCGKLLRRMLAQKFVCRLAAAPFCLIPGSHRLLFAHKRRQKALLSRLCSRGKRNCPSAISTPRLKLSNNTSAGLKLSRPIAARYLWGILSMPYLVEIGRPTPGACRRSCQRTIQPSALHPHEEKRTFSQPIRHRRKQKAPCGAFCGSFARCAKHPLP